MDYFDLAKYSLLGLIGSGLAVHVVEKEMKNYDTIIEEPKSTVSIIVPSYNESQIIEYCMESIRNQNIIEQYPDKFEIILIDSGSTDGTLEKGRPYADKVLISPRGKLTAKNIGIDNAKGDIIVSVDSDSYYPNGWLNTLIKPFNKYNDVVGTVGNTLDYSIPNVPGQIHTFFYTLERVVLCPYQMPGRNCAFRKDAFYKVGKYDDKNYNQLSVADVLYEEEVHLGEKLSKLGNIVFLYNAGCIHLGGIKYACRNNLEVKEKCETLGIGKDRF